MARRRRGLVAEQLVGILDEIEKNLDTGSQNAFRRGATEAVELLKAKSPRKKVKGGQYAAGWTLKPTPGRLKGFVVYNATDYQLTHLLEKGHAKRGGGRVRPIPHIRPVEIVTTERVVRRIEQMPL